MTSGSNRVHAKWPARRAYHETFSNPGPLIFNWHGAPNGCKCGCGGLWYDRVSSTNWWNYFSPGLLLQTAFLFPIFLALHKVIWSLPPVVWHVFRSVRASSKREIPANRKAPYIFTVIISLPLCVVSWTLWPIAVALLTSVVCALFVVAIVAIGMLGFTLVLAGLASVLFSTHPFIGVALIFAGILWEYERNRRNTLKHEELIGSLVLRLRKLDSQRIVF